MIVEHKFGVILADPNWEYDNWTDAKNGAAKSAYKCSATDEIASIPVGEQFAAKNCVLYLWSTLPKLEEAFQVGHAWGFEYVTAIPWFKTIPTTAELAVGVGFWAQGNAELLQVWRRGSPKRLRKYPVVGRLWGDDRAFYAPRKRHSEKPLLVHEWIEKTFPGPYLELYARKKREGWTCWGDELDFHLDKNGVTYIPKETEVTNGLEDRKP